MKFTFPTLATIFALLVLSIGAYMYFIKSENQSTGLHTTSTSTENYICNQDGKICPDGSMVGRTGPMCQFAECPPVTIEGTTTPLEAVGQLYGRVTLSPVCPVERNPPDPNCAPKGYATDVTILSSSTGTVIAGTKTSSDGSFSLRVPVGVYTVRATSGKVYPRCSDSSVNIYARSSSSVVISCDSGIR